MVWVGGQAGWLLGGQTSRPVITEVSLFASAGGNRAAFTRSRPEQVIAIRRHACFQTSKSGALHSASTEHPP